MSKADEFACEILISYKADINWVDRNGKTCLDLAWENNFQPGLQMLLVNGFVLYESDPKMKELIIYACKSGNHLLLKELFRRRIIINEEDPDGNSLPMTTYKWGHYSMCQSLLEEYNLTEIINKTNKKGETLLIMMVIRNDCQSIQLLLRRFQGQLDFDTCDKDGRTALTYAVLNDNYQIAEILLGKKATINTADIVRLTLAILDSQRGVGLGLVWENSDILRG